MLIPVPRPFKFLADNQAASHVYGTVGGFNLNVYYRTLLGYPDGSPARSRFCLNISLEERGSGLIAEPSDLMGNARTPGNYTKGTDPKLDKILGQIPQVCLDKISVFVVKSVIRKLWIKMRSSDQGLITACQWIKNCDTTRF